MPPRKRIAKPERAKRRILIVDDHPLVRRGLTALINAEPDLVVCAEAANSRDGLAAIADAQPDLVIADLSLGDSDGLDLVRQIRSHRGGPRVLVLSMHEGPVIVQRVFAARAHGYVAKREMTETLLIAIRSVLGGKTYGAPAA
jgi:DNA-binding NarL/FixJ family response regulator